VGALFFTETVEHVVRPQKGRTHALRVIRDLVAFRPKARRTDLAAGLNYAGRLLRHRSVVVLLSDFIAADWEQPLRRLSARHDVVVITVDDPRERALPESGWIELADAESGQRVLVDTGNRLFRDRMTRLSEHRREQRRRALMASGVDHLELDTASDYTAPLRRHFAARARRVGRG
jgi:uncharacterized protein (DUF58 family)